MQEKFRKLIVLIDKEIEAYSNEIDFLNNANYDYRKTLSQIKIDINQAIINALSSLR